MSAFAVKFSEVNSRMEQLQSANQQFAQLSEQLQQTEARLNGMWEGEAKDTFHNAFTSDINQLAAFQQLVAKYVQTLGEMMTKYSNVERTNVQIATERKY